MSLLLGIDTEPKGLAVKTYGFENVHLKVHLGPLQDMKWAIGVEDFV
jgi:hypothetical protein